MEFLQKNKLKVFFFGNSLNGPVTGESFDMPNADGKYNDNSMESPRIAGSRRRSVFIRLKTLVMPSQQSMEESSEQGN